MPVSAYGVQPVLCDAPLGSRRVSSAVALLLADCCPTRRTDSRSRLQVGFLYLRYVLNPRKVWEWIEPYLGDHEVGAGLCRRTMRICSGFCCQAQNITIKLASAPLPAMPVQTGFS